MATIPDTRNDAAQLRAPVRMATGALKCQAVLDACEVKTYSWGTEYTPPEVISSQEWRDSLAGLRIVWNRKDAKHAKRRPTVGDDGGAERTGGILSARWDAQYDGVGAALADVIFDEPAAFEAIAAGMLWLSGEYKADNKYAPGVSPDGIAYQYVQTRRYDAVNYVMTNSPRGSRAAVRTDAQEGPLDDEDLKKIGLLLDEKIKPLQVRLDAAEAKLKAPDAPRLDAAGDWEEVIEAARLKGVNLDGKLSLADARKLVVVAITPERADAVDHATAITMFLAGNKATPQRSDAWRSVREGTRTGVARRDAANNDDDGDIAADVEA